MRTHRRPAEDLNREDGFTLVELSVTMAIAGILASIATFGFTSYQNLAEQRGTAQQLTSELRKASVRATSEGRTYCVSVDDAGTSYSLWRYACDTTAGTRVTGPFDTQSSDVTIVPTVTTPTPAPTCTTGGACLYFYPRGTALPASLVVQSTARSNLYTIRVEGLTSRVY